MSATEAAYSARTRREVFCGSIRNDQPKRKASRTVLTGARWAGTDPLVTVTCMSASAQQVGKMNIRMP